MGGNTDIGMRPDQGYGGSITGAELDPVEEAMNRRQAEFDYKCSEFEEWAKSVGLWTAYQRHLNEAHAEFAKEAGLEFIPQD